MCDYPSSHTSSKVTEFIANTFIEQGVRTFYGLNHPADCRNNLTLDHFKDIQDGKKVVLVNDKGKTYQYSPPAMNISKEIACSMKHSNIYCIDIDGKSVDDKTFLWNDIPDIFKQCPYTKSRNKKLPHFYFRMSGIDHTILKRGTFMNASNNLNFCKGELLTNTVWETNKGQIWNYDGELPLLAWNDVKMYLKQTEVTKFEIQAKIRSSPTITFDNEQETTEDEDSDSKSATTNEDDSKDSNSVLSNKPNETKDESKKSQKMEKSPKILETAKNKENVDKNRTKNLQTITDLREGFSKKRLSGLGDYREGTWKRFTLAMYNAFEDEGKQLWTAISKKGDNYNENGNEKCWKECVKMSEQKKKKDDEKLGYNSLLYWIKQDSPNLYNEYFKIVKNVNFNRLTDYTFALDLEKKLTGDNNKSKVVFTGKQTKMTGYLFNGVYWKELGLHNAEIKKKHFAELYLEYIHVLNNTTFSHDENIHRKIRNIHEKEIKALDCSSRRNSIIESLQTERYVSKIEWNKKPYLFVSKHCPL